MAPIVSTIEIARPPADVFSYATDPSRFHDWQKGVVSGSMEGDGAPAVRSKTIRPPSWPAGVRLAVAEELLGLGH